MKYWKCDLGEASCARYLHQRDAMNNGYLTTLEPLSSIWLRSDREERRVQLFAAVLVVFFFFSIIVSPLAMLSYSCCHAMAALIVLLSSFAPFVAGQFQIAPTGAFAGLGLAAACEAVLYQSIN